MHFRFMKAVDTLVGTPACLWLTLLRLIRLSVAPRRPPAEVRTILITKYFGMGSILMMSPMLRALRRRFPDARICMLTFAPNEPLLRRLNLLDELLTLNPERIVRFPFQVLAMIFRLRRMRPDVVLDLEFYSRFAMLIAALSGSPKVVGFCLGQKWRRWLLDERVFLNHYRHITDNYMEFARRLDAPDEPLTLSRPAVPQEARRRVAELLSEHDGDGPLIGVNPNASALALERRWPGPRFAQLIGELSRQRPAARFVLVGARSERSYVESVIDACDESTRGRLLNTAGALSFDELLALLERLDLFVTNDSGPLHLAASLDVRTVSLFGPETPVLYGPVGDGHRVVFRNVFCSPCLNAYNSKTPWCRGNNICLKDVPVDEVRAAVREQLSELAPPEPDAAPLPLRVLNRAG